jgi:hypothetical protein
VIDYERWVELADRDAIGETLSNEERAFLLAYAQTNPMAAAELSLFENLVGDAPDDVNEIRDRALADAAVREALSQTVALPALPKQPRRSRWLLWGVGSAAAAAAAVAFMARTPRVQEQSIAGISVVEYVASSVQVGGQTVQQGTHVAVGGEVTALGGPVCVAVEPRIHACLAEGAKMRLSAVGAGKRRIDLVAGRVAVALDPLPVGERLSVVANGVWSTAVGTAFTVELLADGRVQTVVHEGKVAVGAEGSNDIVAGHKIGLAVGPAVRIEPPVPHATTETPDWIALSKVASRNIEGPTAELAALPVPEASVAKEEPVAPSMHGMHLAKGTSRPMPAAVDEAAPEAPAATTASLLAAARQALRDQRWGDAAANYRQLVQSFPSTPEAHTVLVSLAKVELQRLGQPAVALRDLDAYLASGGPLALEARIEKARAFRALGRTSDEAAAIDEVLAAHAGGLEVEELRQRRQELGTH